MLKFSHYILNILFILLLPLSLTAWGESLSTSKNCDKSSLDFTYIYQQLSDIKQNDIKITHSEVYGEQLASIDIEKYLSLYNQCIAPWLSAITSKQLDKQLNKQQIHKLYRAISNIAFYTSDIKAINDLERLTKLKLSKGEQPKRLITTLYRALIRTRQFERAKLISQQYPQLNLNQTAIITDQTSGETEPYQAKNDGIRSYFEIVEFDDATTPIKITRERFDFPKGPHIVVVSSAICGPCKRLFTWLKSEPQLMQVMNQHATWLTPAEDSLFADEMLSTYQTYTPIKLNYVHHQSQWPEITFWATPSFYFYLDGKLQGQLVGWPKGGQKQLFLRALKTLGLSI